MRSVFLAALVAALVVSLAGCSALPAAPPPVTAAALVGSEWKETCVDDASGQRAAQAWVQLREGGVMAYSFDTPDGDWIEDGTDAWSLAGTTLTVSWTDGFAVSTYDLTGARPDGRVPGTTSLGCEGGTFLTRI